MRRREVIGLLSIAVGWPYIARAQKPAGVPTIGYLSAGSETGFRTRLQAFREGLRESGYREGKMLRSSTVGRMG
jgi:putative ABC transport system substrate-binding protein